MDAMAHAMIVRRRRRRHPEGRAQVRDERELADLRELALAAHPQGMAKERRDEERRQRLADEDDREGDHEQC
jgi:hypothetical protein